MQKSSYIRFIIRCVHSISGCVFTLFLCEHLLTNILAASCLANSRGFIALVNMFHKIPGLKIIEISCLALPLGIHTIIGFGYLLRGKENFFASDGRAPSLHYGRNLAYTVQRITAWFLLISLAFHVVQFRFALYPIHVKIQGKTFYAVSFDAPRYSAVVRGTTGFFTMNVPFAEEGPQITEQFLQEKDRALFSSHKLYIFTPEAGKAFLYAVRNTLGSLWMAIFYTFFVMAAVFHGFNGIWTFVSRWGIIVRSRYLRLCQILCYIGMFVVMAMGVSVIWNIYLL
ncbi:succinate dehydrogenase [Chlamydia muridarum str. Nigg CM972]|nr:succinate dehydrogenase [Chlamydia muridarum str. Nigg3 CMUT3-5]AHH24196.1 succinate dehydrogenase [Chlamydia muridarum str. Nigg CM972]